MAPTVAQVKAELSNDAKKKAGKKVTTKKRVPLTLPASCRINDYGFLGFRKPLLDALSFHKGEKLTIDKNADGSVTLRKA
jgi:hypothetical protein